MVEGMLVAESLRPGSKLTGLDLVVSSLERVAVTGVAEGQPSEWTLISFRSALDPANLAALLSGAMLAPGWYADFYDDSRRWVIYPAGVVFSFTRGDPAERQAAVDHGRGLGIPAEQLDWRD
jgi:hypothetical protein